MAEEILTYKSGNKRLENDAVMRFSDIFFVLSIPLRISIVDFLVHSETPQRVTEIVAACDSEQAVISGHLKILYQKRILERDRKGICVYYRISNQDASNFVKWIHEWVALNEKERGAEKSEMSMSDPKRGG